MPTPVSTARQCLTEEAARVLDDAVALARRRSHAQTTSLHGVSALLALPSSALRDACAQARSLASSPRLQFRALELCIGVSLDRQPSSKGLDEPPISNSLMAAIKRSQANQRRHPETFHLYQQMQQNNPSSMSCVKVELKHFILSILDDPIVSRLFGEAGFRSYDIKLAILNPPTTISRFSRTRCPPLFLSNLPELELNRRGFNFPFAGFSVTENCDENSRRIGEVLIKKKAKNPLLVGFSANDALDTFTESVQRGKSGILPKDIGGLKVVCIEKRISEFVVKVGREEMMGLKFKEVSDMVELCTGNGVLINYGEMKVLVDGASADAVNYVVSGLSKLVEVHRGKLWLIGATESCDTYRKLLARFPSIEKDWDLHLLPITSSKPSFGRLCSKSSLMASFVPFGGFFTASEFENPLSRRNKFITLCDMCNEKYEREVSSIISVSEQNSAGLISWLQMADCSRNGRSNAVEAKDDGTVSNARLTGLQRKWNDICQHLHQTQLIQQDNSQDRSQFHGVEGFQFLADTEDGGKMSLLNASRCRDLSSCMPIDLQKNFQLKHNTPVSVVSCTENSKFYPTQSAKISKMQQPETESSSCTHYPPHGLILPPDCMSSSSVNSVMTDLGLGTFYAFVEQDPTKCKFQDNKNHGQNFSGSVNAELDRISENSSTRIVQSSSCSGLEFRGQLDSKDFKYLWKFISEKVGWQDEAINAISQAVSHCRDGYRKHGGSNHRGDVWLSFLGPDKVGKKRVALALAEIIFGTRESLISVNLSSEDGISCSGSIFDHLEFRSYDVKFRGKMVVDYIAEEMVKKPRSLMLLENVDEADFLAQNCLFRAIRTGRFPDSHGREISINNMIFVVTTNSSITNNSSTSVKETLFSEEQVLGARGLQMQILVECVHGDFTRTNDSNVSVMSRKGTSSSLSVNKRKLVEASHSKEQDKMSEPQKRLQKVAKSCLDLNLPVAEMEEDIDCRTSGNDMGSENAEAWLEAFLDQVDEKVIFKPFDFDALAKNIVKDISLHLQKITGSEVLLEIDSEVMVQILAAAWLSDDRRVVEDWVEKVLCRSFSEAKRKYNLTVNLVLKLVASEGFLVEEVAPGVCLPATVSVN